MRRLLDGTRLLTLTGVGGAGKTRLGLELARVVAEDFPDGVWFVDLSPLRDPASVVAEASAAMGVSPEGPPRSNSMPFSAVAGR